VKRIQQLPVPILLSLIPIIIAFGMIIYGVLGILNPQHPLVGCWETDASFGIVEFTSFGKVHEIYPLFEPGWLPTGEWRVINEETIELDAEAVFFRKWEEQPPILFKVQPQGNTIWLVSTDLIIKMTPDSRENACERGYMFSR
jgi:hypothetical protein